MLFVAFPSGGCGVPAVIQGGVGSLRSRPCVLLFSSGSPAVSPWRSAFVLAMALRADSPYVVIPVPDPFLWHWFVWQAWMPFHFAMALHQCMPCPCCGFFGSDRPQAGHGSCDVPADGPRVEICLARHLPFSDQISQSASSSSRKPHVRTTKRTPSRARVVEVRTKERGFDDELLEHAMKVFAQQAGLEDLQVDWNSSGLGAVKHDICDHNLVLPQVQKSAYATGEQVVLRGLKTAGMNGQTGTVTTCLRSGRYGVLLSNGGQVAIRPCNLDVLPDAKALQWQTSQMNAFALVTKCC